MRIGVPKEVKADEYRVAMMPVGADVLVRTGHEVFIEASAGIGSGFGPMLTIRKSARENYFFEPEDFAKSDLIVKQ